MDVFHGTPIYRSDACDEQLLALSGATGAGSADIPNAIEQGRLVLIRSIPFAAAAACFGRLVDRYGLRDSYDIQMQYVVTLMASREAIEDVAVTVNRRDAYQIIQPHCEGDSTSPLDLFGLYCVQNAKSGGENILSAIDQNADHSRLRAKEKAIVGGGLSSVELGLLRERHLDARDVLPELPAQCRILQQTPRGSVVVRPVPIRPSKSAITGRSVVTYWDNVTVHDRAFHRYQHGLLNHLSVLHAEMGPDYEAYMHVEADSDWAPADTDSGDVAQTSQLFRCHVVHKMEAGDFLVFDNRVWTHSVNNWPPDQTRKLCAMYA